MTDILRRLAENSRSAVGDGTYDVDCDLGNSGRDLAGVISASRRPVLITEVKFASPSQGRIRTPSDPAEIARRMVAGGASAVSVLTQPHLFGGSPGHFEQVRRAVDVPMLMKDVIVDTVQLDAAQKLGADYVLLIQSLFSEGHLEDVDRFVGEAHGRGLGVLLEVHTTAELAAALGTGADLLGVNNRDLDTLGVDLETTRRVLGGYGGRTPVVSESGISEPEDIVRLRGYGASAFLVGSSIMADADVEGRVRRLAGAY